MGQTEHRIAQWIVETSFEDIPSDAVRVANEAVFDQVGVTLAGSVQQVGKHILKYGRDASGPPESSVIGGGFKTAAAQAALLNGTTGHALDYDDGAGWGHPSTVLLPPLLAIGEKVGASGRDVLEAYIVGFEVAYNLSKGGRYNQMSRGINIVATFGTMGATAAAAKIIRLNEMQTVMALGIAGSMSSGICQNLGSMAKPLHGGLAARNGVMSALLANEGMSGTSDVFEGPVGWAHVMFGEGMFDTEKMVDGLDRPFGTQDLIALKRYPCCYGNHSMLDALLALIEESNLKYEDIARVEIGNQSYQSAVMMFGKPTTGLEAKFSILYNAAIAILEGTPRIEHFTDERVNDPKLQEAMEKVRVEVLAKWDPRITKPELQAKMASSLKVNPVTVYLNDGRILTKAVARDQLVGTQQRPWGEENIRRKFEENAALVLPRTGVSQAIDIWRNIDQVGDIRQALDVVRGNSQ